MIANKLDLSIFDYRYKNDQTGATANHSKILLKVILMAYSRGIPSSRDIEPVFVNITSTLDLKRFRLRGKVRVTAQWLAFCLAYNIRKIQRYGPSDKQTHSDTLDPGP